MTILHTIISYNTKKIKVINELFNKLRIMYNIIEKGLMICVKLSLTEVLAYKEKSR
ncbi:MAG: hypothetical protein K0Q49_643 [Haloplasmataceae bacterium]|jgi:hypothetical protein|nr:hypothetical protein [Haloplasmataceae bacterium]